MMGMPPRAHNDFWQDVHGRNIQKCSSTKQHGKAGCIYSGKCFLALLTKTKISGKCREGRCQGKDKEVSTDTSSI
jgi:hypothetical protein